MIQVKNLTKHFILKKRKSGFFGSVKALFSAEREVIRAVDDVSFRIKKGELVGYIGPNGAGKSTTIKMLTGILTPSHGEILIDGLNPSKNRKENAFQIGVVFGQRTQLWWDLPVEESFDLLKSIYKIDEKLFKKRLEFFFDLLGLEEFYKQQARKLSLGQRMKADIAASLIHSPKVLFLDEPTIGLDLIVKEKVRNFIQKINFEDKVTIILTTHDVGDIEYLANRIIVLDKGKIGYDGNISNFNKLLGNESVVNLHFQTPVKNINFPKPFRVKEKISDTQYKIIIPEKEPLSSLLSFLQKKRIKIQEIQKQNPDLGLAIKKMYSGKEEL
ncbi:MAG: ATP-binding cassette domain-containing protein [Leptospiraceae bacterium]|nr:ATP-binding cassette domain-containing protein [Leptospiraceae bacterium]MCK6381942.1 ATP-binding cassette domain-containing protein [Leptospiraceae bacterium]NUM42088.1 ATP-binding cassette domain-containing protein [Leptospiraceae bacterium]